MVDEAMLEEVLGPPHYGGDEAELRVANAGSVTGLVWTEAGGQVIAKHYSPVRRLQLCVFCFVLFVLVDRFLSAGASYRQDKTAKFLSVMMNVLHSPS